MPEHGDPPIKTSYLLLLQRCIETLYRLEPAPHIEEFLLPDEVAEATGESAQPQEETLYLVEDDELHVGLKLAEHIIAVLSDQQLDRANLPAFCLAVEGVSHFLCVMHRAREDIPTSALELEVQAEVDKYIVALLLARRCPSLRVENLRPLLYRHYVLVKGLSSEQATRYQRANDLAARYTQTLERRYIHPRRMAGLVRELRHFYRLGLQGKQDLILKAA